MSVVPRDVVAACAPQPKDIGDEMTGRMLVGVHCIGKKNGDKKEYFIYQPFDNQASMKRWHSQAVTAQTGFGAALSIELIGRGIWKVLPQNPSAQLLPVNATVSWKPDYQMADR